LIVELTERIGRLVYYPCWLVLVLLLARNGWWDTLSWPAPMGGRKSVAGKNAVVGACAVL